MKKFIFMTALAATMGLMTSCSEDELTSPSNVDNNTIAFATKSNKAMTRSASTLTELEKFTVSANNADNSIFFADQLFTYDMGASIFKSATPYYWPLGGSLSFYAINEPGTKSLDGNNIPSYSYENWAGETDLVAATVLSGSKTVPYPLTFQHVTSQVYVTAEAINKTEDLTYKLISVKMATPSTGTYSFADATGGQGSWVIDNDKTSEYSFAGGMPIEIDQNGKANPSDVYWNILPNDKGRMDFTVEYQVYQNGQKIADFTGSDAKKAQVMTPHLQMGKKYIYNFLMSRGTDDDDDVISFTTTVLGWEDGAEASKEASYDDYVFPFDGTENGYKYIDLGVVNSEGKSVLFATCNLGADHPMMIGDYYQWACTESCGLNAQDWSTYSMSPGLTGSLTYGYGEEVFTKYNPADGLTTMELEDDAVHQHMGGDWRLPTQAEWALMMNQCDVEKTTISDVYGLKVTSKTDDSKYIFLPAEGLIIDSGLEYVNDRVRYWSSTLSGNKRFAYYLSASLDKDPSANSWMTIRCFGMNLRGVVVK